MSSRLSLLRCSSYDPAEVGPVVRRSLELLGGMSAFAKPGSAVLVKPNLLTPTEPELGITTHPEVVRAVVKLLKEIGCSVYIGDGPTAFGLGSEGCDGLYEKTGMERVAKEEGAELAKFDKVRWRGKFPLSSWLDKCDFYISLPKFKTHQLTTLTAGIKNNFGLLSEIYKKEMHIRHFKMHQFAGILVDIYQEARPSLTLVDGIISMEGDGPGSAGTLRSTGLLLAGSDCVAIDSVLASVMGISPLDVPATKEAVKRRLGEADLGSIEILGDKLEGFIEPGFKLPTASLVRKIPAPIANIARKLIRFYPCVEADNCVSCAACVRGCPNQAIRMKERRIIFDYKKCVRCFCCQEGCPSSAIRIKRSLLARIAKL